MWKDLCPNNRNSDIIEDIIDHHNYLLIPINEFNVPTHFIESSDKETTIDITLTTSDIALKTPWRRHNRRFGSDHYPQIIDYEQQLIRENVERPPKWKLKTAE